MNSSAPDSGNGPGPVELSDAAKRFLDSPYACVLTTLRKDGRPVSNVIWCGREDQSVVFTAGHDVMWLKRLRRDPRVAIAVPDPEDMEQTLTGYGRVVSITDDPDYAFADSLAQIYEGKRYDYSTPEEYARLKVEVALDRVFVHKDGELAEQA